MANSKKFHDLYGIRKPRINYKNKDFLDYTLMMLICAVVSCLAYGFFSSMSVIAIALCIYMIIVFPVRHGIKFEVPAALKRPQDILYMVLYKVKNTKSVFLFAVGFLLLENYLIYLTPELPHKVDLVREVSLYAFYLHMLIISGYRTVILVAHLNKKDHIREVLLNTSWKSSVSKGSSVTLEIFHAYFTGLLAHIMLIAPWYMVISNLNFSLIFLPFVLVINIVTQLGFYKVANAWFYRDHWLGHNSEIEFLYLHGPHHDAIPSGLIGVSGTGNLEGFLRHVIGYPTPFFNPVLSFFIYTSDVKIDIEGHQYIPGVYPELSKEFHQVTQHSIHHFGHLRPYGIAMKLDQPGVSQEMRKKFSMVTNEIKNSAALEECLGFDWDNSRHKWYLGLVDKYGS